jgi:glyoxylase-like metal-dependent hydrolase (beta-lactamase superfamily II)/cell division septum initiation protein DivIVA
MPDQNSAASEHSIMQQITQPLIDLPEDPVGEVASVEFPIVLRGYEREMVDAYVRHVTQLVAELHASRSPEGAVRRAYERVGEQVSDILGRAHETAEQITSQSRAEAEDRLMRARTEAEALARHSHELAQRLESEARTRAQELTRAGEERVRELDAEVDRIWAERDRIVADTRRLSEELAEIASVAATRFPAATTDEAPVLTPEPPAEQDEFSVVPAEEEEFAGEPASDDELAAFSGDTEEHEPFGFSGDTGEEEIAVFANPRANEPTVGEQPTSVLPRPRMRLIDLHHLGRERVIGCWVVDGVLIDPGPASCLQTLLEALGGEEPEAVLLTHIHLDHAGATGSLVARWPELEVYVHENGAPHLTDPTRLLESARRLYGADMERLWGDVLAVPEANLRVLRGGEWLFDGSFEVAYTPGHASHHVSYLHDGTAFVGDVGGVRITPDALTIPPTPPPDVDIEAWHRSIEQVLEWRPERLAMTHFGSSEDVEQQLAELSERLDSWTALARTEDLDTFVTVVENEITRSGSPHLRGSYVQAAPPEQLYLGLERYWHKRDTTAEASTHAGKSGRAKPSV